MTDAANAEQAATTDPPANPPAPGGVAGEVPPVTWQLAKNGRQFLRIPGIGGYQGCVWRKGDESIDDAITRHRKGGADRAPRSRKARAGEHKTVKSTPAVSRDDTTRKIQEMCADLLCSPSIPLAGFGFEWEADHFAVQGGRFAANIARSSERNPWLRRYLERGLDGEQSVVAVLTTFNLATGAAGYILPPLMKWGVIPAPYRAKRAFGVPTPRPATPEPPPPAYQAPPIVTATESVAELWAAAERAASQAGSPVDLGAYAAGDGNTAEHEGVSQPPTAFADQV